MDPQRLSFLALRMVPGIGDLLIKQLISYCGSADAVFKTTRGKLQKIPGIGPAAAAAIRTDRTLHEAEKEMRKAEKDNVEILFYTDKKYPDRLKIVEDSPAVLYLKGNMNLNFAKTVAIVGTRQATAYGKERVDRIVEELVSHHTLVVSGLAYGIDIHAHRQALRHNLPTVGILGSGIDVIYPSAHQDTARKMMDQGGLVTENAYGTQPDAHNFPARNRIIAGLSDALIVIEAAAKGGALITAEIANSYNKDVFAIPGNIGQTYSEGCNKLIKINKANLLTSVKDLEYIMNWGYNIKPKQRTMTLLFDIAQLEPNEQKVVKSLKDKNSPMTIDELSYKSTVPPGAISSVLLNLEFKGIVVSLPGKVFKLA